VVGMYLNGPPMLSKDDFLNYIRLYSLFVVELKRTKDDGW
jgi:hypothetical protein